MKIGFIIFFLFSNLFYSQIREKLFFNDLKLMNLKGNVKAIKERKYEVNFRNNKVTFENGVLMPTSFNYYFNNDGFVYYKEGIKNFDGKEKISTKQIFEFENKRLLKDTYLIVESNYIDSLQWIYKYPNDSITIVLDNKGAFKGLVHQFIQNGNKEIETTLRPEENIILGNKKFIYNDDNQIVQFEESDKDGKITEKFFRNINVKCRNFDDEKSISYTYKFNSHLFNYFDDNCNIVKETWENDVGVKTLELNYKYQFDKEGNWVEQKLYNNFGKIVFITKRDITYY